MEPEHQVSHEIHSFEPEHQVSEIGGGARSKSVPACVENRVMLVNPNPVDLGQVLKHILLYAW